MGARHASTNSKTIIRLHELGKTPGEIAEAIDATGNTVRKFLRKHGLMAPYVPSVNNCAANHDAIVEHLSMGSSYEQISRRFGIPRMTVRDYAIRHNMARRTQIPIAKHRPEIERLIAEGKPLAWIAKHLGVRYHSLRVATSQEWGLRVPRDLRPRLELRVPKDVYRELQRRARHRPIENYVLDLLIGHIA